MTTAAALGSRNAVRAVDATKTYGTGAMAVTALDRVSLTVPEGSFTVIMGPSGSGKSTLLQCLAGLDQVTSGEVYIGDVGLSGASEGRLTALRRDTVGFIFQGFNLLPALTARENILLPSGLAGTRPDPQWVQQVVTTLGLTERLEHRPAEMSGGQQQRVAIARALIARPKVVFADEPTGNLDTSSGEEVLRTLTSAVRDLGQTVVMVTHDARAAGYGDEVVFLADGRLAGRLADPTEKAVLDRLKALG